MQLGRLRTWLNAVLKRPQLKHAQNRAWEIYEPVVKRLKVSWQLRRGDRVGRFALNILQAGLTAPVRYLEIGAFEGNSVAFVHALLEGKVDITVIDPFTNYSELADKELTEVYETFISNLQAIGVVNNVRILKGRSIDHLPRLCDAGEQFDLIFIDGSHENLDVMVDAALGWRLLAHRGLMIFDDYWYRRPDLGRSFRPKLAVDAFVGAMSHEIEVVNVAGQVFIRRR